MTDQSDRLIQGLNATYPDLDVDAFQVTARLARIGLYLSRRQEDVFGRFGLGRGEVGLLALLRVSGPNSQLSPTRLSRALLLSSAGVTSRIDRLERRGLIVRLPDADDRRGVLVELTDKGRELVDAAIAANTTSESEVLSRLDADERATLEQLLRKVISNLEPAGG